MNRFKVSQVKELFEYANCSHANAMDLNALFKFHLIREKIPGYDGNTFDLISHAAEKCWPEAPQTLVNLMNPDIIVDNDYMKNPNARLDFELLLKYFAKYHVFDSSVTDTKVFISSVIATRW